MPPELRSAYEAAEETMRAFDKAAALTHLSPTARDRLAPPAREVQLACALLVTRELVEAALDQAAAADEPTISWYAEGSHAARTIDAARAVRKGGAL
jgi:hypothetical protein